MKRILFILTIAFCSLTGMNAQGYNVGDKASDFKLKNVDGKLVSLADFNAAKGFVVIFTCNHCPFAMAYQDRIIALDNKYKTQGYPVIAISSNDPSIVPEDSYDNMVIRAKEKSYPFPYLFDETQEVYRKYGARKTPHVYVLQKKGTDLVVQYIGAIDDNYKDATAVTATYLSNALDAILANKTPDPSMTKAIGCSIKDKQTQP